MSLSRAMMEENGDLRYRTGSGDPNLSVLLGNTLLGEGVGTSFGAAGGLSGTSRIATVKKDVRLAAVASGSSSSGGGSSGSGGGGGGSAGNDSPRYTSRK